jgi:LmbE family N-acetylglucosaminyl deacetylase
MHLRSQDDLLGHSGRPTVIFSPHQDDEVLGCGGMIIRKRRLGATVYIVFMTDGRASHKSRFINPLELAELRKIEAQKCARIMGVPEENLIFLGFEDRFLCHHAVEAQIQARHILQTLLPAEIFVPFRREAPADHHATYRIVRDALREINGSDLPAIDLYEYFVWTPRLWFWKIRELFESDTWRRIDVREVQLLKKNALERYRSQMTALFPDPQWATLPQDLLTWSSQPYEYYLKNLKLKTV